MNEFDKPNTESIPIYKNDKINSSRPSEIHDDKLQRSSITMSNNFESRICLSNKKLAHIENTNQILFSTKNNFKKDDFEIFAIIGRGAYAKVVKARIIKNKQIVAIKIINKSFIIKVK